MKLVYSLVILSCALWEAKGFPYYGAGNVDTLSYGDSSRGGMVLSRYYNPYYNPRAVGGGMAAFMYRQPEEQTQHQSSQYYLPDRRRQTSPDINFNVPPQQNEIYYPQQPEVPVAIPTEVTELAEPTEKAEILTTTLKSIVVSEIAEPDVEEVAEEEPVPKPKKVVPRKKQVKRPIEEEDEEEDTAPRFPGGTFFPMFFGWGGRSAGGPSGPTAIANAYSTGRGGVATSHATAYGEPRPVEKV